MTGRTNFNTLRGKMSAAQKVAADKKYKEIRQEMDLAELRRLTGLTQKELADKLGVTQPNVSDREKQSDMGIETLAKMVEALVGRLEVNAIMPAGVVHVRQFDRPQPNVENS